MKRVARKNNTIIIVTGMSGAGKSNVLKYLEDMGYFCVDNLPILLMPKFLDVVLQSTKNVGNVAFGIDVREKNFLHAMTPMLRELSHRSIGYRILFLEAADAVLIRRFSETRRKHPLHTTGRTIAECIRLERSYLSEVRKCADTMIDTSQFTPAVLREIISDVVHRTSRMSVTIVSFGYKYGVPLEADMVFDTRFLPNPFYDDRLRMYTGNEKKVRDFVLLNPLAKTFLTKLRGMFSFLIPLFLREGKSYCTIGLGCTGGKHRSVAVANELKTFFEKKKLDVRVIHRDILK